VTFLIPIALVGWIAVAVGLFGVLPPRRALFAAFLGAWLFLPQAGIPIPGLPDLDRISATSLGALLGVAMFDARRLFDFRPSWIDLPIVSWFAAVFMSSIVNGLGIYDGAATMLGEIFTWGIPYLLGRLYINDLVAAREFAMAIAIGGLIYVPLCLFEVRFSPQLHRWVYGYHANQFAQTIRFGGYRPTVFMQHGIAVGVWMTSASVVLLWLWQTGSVRRLFGMPAALLVPALIGTSVICKSMGALALLGIGAVILYSCKWLRPISLLVVLAAIALPPLYMMSRGTGRWSGDRVVEVAAMIDTERASSLHARLYAEQLYVQRAMQRPVFGWGRWGRWRVEDEERGRKVATDGFWIITLGQHGVVGLVTMTSMFLVPPLLLVRRIKPKYWSHPAAAAPAAMAVLLILYAMDNLLNAMINPIFLLCAGGLSGLYLSMRRPRGARAHARQRPAIMTSQPTRRPSAVAGA
jgi:hypothetical protein